MASVERPLSPHLQVYRPQWPSVLSISHRATGIALVAGALVLVWWLAAAAGSPEHYAAFTGVAGSIIGQLALFVWTLCLFYHLMNGIRQPAQIRFVAGFRNQFIGCTATVRRNSDIRHGGHPDAPRRHATMEFNQLGMNRVPVGHALEGGSLDDPIP